MAPKSRWADGEEDRASEEKRKAERQAKKRAKLDKQRQAESAQGSQHTDDRATVEGEPPAKRRRLTPETERDRNTVDKAVDLLRFPAPGWGPCRHVDNFEKLNHIEEGSYGWVSRARETATGEIVALKKLKMDHSGKDGFPVTGLREIETLTASRHPHIVTLREVVTGDSPDDVFLVMDFLEHDLRTLAETMSEPFSPSEVKALLQQLGSAVDYLHSNWILHRDLKTSNVLMNNRGQIKLADFGMARYFGDPAPRLTQLVVTLWYRPPELILGAEAYGTEVDMWSVGCIFAELLVNEPLLQGKNEVDQLTKIFELCGVPDEASWPGFRRLPNAKSLRLPRDSRAKGSVVRTRFAQLTNAGCSLLDSLLSLNPVRRPGAAEMLKHAYFAEDPRPKNQAMFPTFPSKASQEKKRKLASPNAPIRGAAAPEIRGDSADFSSLFAGRQDEESGGNFRLRMV